MRLVIDTNVIVSPLADDEFAEDSLLSLKMAKKKGHISNSANCSLRILYIGCI